MTHEIAPKPIDFLALLNPPEKRRRIAILNRGTLYQAANWLSVFRNLANTIFDRFDFRINPMRLHCYVDGWREPVLSLTIYESPEEFGAVTAEMRFEGMIS